MNKKLIEQIERQALELRTRKKTTCVELNAALMLDDVVRMLTEADVLRDASATAPLTPGGKAAPAPPQS